MELKFRQWIKSTKEFHYWGYIIEHEAIDIYGRYFQSPLGPMDGDKRESQQYIELEDFDETEIYKGDVLEFYNVQYTKETKEVKFINNHNFCGWNISQAFIQSGQARVIGNVHENPELEEGHG